MTESTTAPEIRTYAARRRLKVGDGYREPNQPYPEGHLVYRIDSLVHVGMVGELHTTEEQFRANLDEFVPPEQHEAILARVGLIPGVINVGPHGTLAPADPEVEVPIVPADKPADERIDGPVRRPTKKLPTKRVPRKSSKPTPVDGEAPAEVQTQRTNTGRSPLVVPMRALEDETSLLDEV